MNAQVNRAGHVTPSRWVLDELARELWENGLPDGACSSCEEPHGAGPCP